MPKPSTARPATKSKPTEAPKPPPAKRVRAIKTGHNEYSIVEESFEGPPTSTKVLQSKTDGAGAMYWVRLWHEEQLGPNRLGGSGL